MKEIRIWKWTFRLPEHRLARIAIGVLLVILGFFGFLPVLGFWMIPLGLAIISYEVPFVRRLRRRFIVWLYRFIHRHFPALARRLGMPPGNGGNGGNGRNGRKQDS